ncbi:unnamed protein product [Rhizoctonia solani]|uniref:Uncharacterized protein n=1 Tax=Rhizoctonia solani TaxID=456999 RepID=A0A8H3DW15_9AGAM|nr:unnamed protein product [Rhizoctonia solani]
MPYSDWTLGAHDGKEEDDWVVTDGAFANTLHAYPVPRYPCSRFTPQTFVNNLIFPFEYTNKTAFANETFTPEAIEFLVDNFEGDLATFFAGVDGPTIQGLRSGLHILMGGRVRITRVPGLVMNHWTSDMSDPSLTPSEPLFWFHPGASKLHTLFYFWWYLRFRSNWTGRGPLARASSRQRSLVLRREYARSSSLRRVPEGSRPNSKHKNDAPLVWNGSAGHPD